jgi:hypothetical protein
MGTFLNPFLVYVMLIELVACSAITRDGRACRKKTNSASGLCRYYRGKAPAQDEAAAHDKTAATPRDERSAPLQDERPAPPRDERPAPPEAFVRVPIADLSEIMTQLAAIGRDTKVIRRNTNPRPKTVASVGASIAKAAAFAKTIKEDDMTADSTSLVEFRAKQTDKGYLTALLETISRALVKQGIPSVNVIAGLESILIPPALPSLRVDPPVEEGPDHFLRQFMAWGGLMAVGSVDVVDCCCWRG